MGRAAADAADQLFGEKGKVRRWAQSGSKQRPLGLTGRAFVLVDRVPPAGIEPATRGLGNPVSTSMRYD
jgi:hypothetical protein